MGGDLGNDNTESFVGRFSRSDRDEIAIRSPNWLGLFSGMNDLTGLRLSRNFQKRLGKWLESGR